MRGAVVAVWALLALVAPATAAAQADKSPVPEVDPVIAEIEARLAGAEGDASLADEVKSRVLELLKRSIVERRRAAEVAGETAAVARRVGDATSRIAELKALLEKPAAEVDPGAYDAMPVNELATRAREKQQQLDVAREELKAREKYISNLAALGPVLSDEIAGRRKALRALQEEAEAMPPGELPITAAARTAWIAAREARLEAEIEKAELQLANYEPLVRLATLERDVAAMLVPRLDAEREALGQAVEAQRVDEARAALQDAQMTEQAAADLPGAVGALATENAALREELEKVTQDTRLVAERLRASERRESELEADLVSIRERVDSVGATEAVGRLLRRRLRSLRGLQADRLRAFGRANEIVRATDRRIDLGEQRRELADARARADEIVAGVPAAERAAFGEPALRDRAADLVAAKRATVDALHEAYGRYLTQLTGYDAVERELDATVASMREFIRRELLWIRSLPPIEPADLASAPASLAPLFDIGNWGRAIADVHAAMSQQPERALPAVLGVLVLLVMRPWARRRLAALGELTMRIRTDAFRHTVTALVLSVLIALGWPAVLYVAGWLAGAADSAAPFSEHVSITLRRLARLLFIFSSARWLIHYNGLARRHFRWPEPVRVQLRQEFRWLTVIGIVCVVVGVYGSVAETQGAALALGRPALMVFDVALAVFFWRVFRAGSPVMEASYRRNADALVVRTWRLWFSLLVGVPALNAVAAAAGYNDAARTATLLIIDSGWLLLGVWVLRDTILRWFTVAERRLRFERLLKQREEARAERERQQQEAGDDAHGTEAADVDVPEVDYQSLGEQARVVVQVTMAAGVVLALWALWSDLLPALTALDRISLPMSRLALVDGVEQRVAVNVTDVLVALLVLAATLFTARNLSGLLGFTLLRRLAGDPGAQYAVVTLAQYVLVAAGVLYALSEIGVQWSKLQWLVAALGVGLGFGLQEIVANFVSGIILLLERPVRVGDVVTVGDATGRVARIRIRATTIVDWDRKELVVPNKEFVTGRLLNWTLSNDVLRLVVPVGIAYGSDPRRARELLLEAAAENEHVLEDPAPIVLFNSFGDNALGLELRVYLPSIEHLLTVQTALHDATYEKFERAGIVISFPQRDVHLDTSAPLDIRLHGDGDGDRGGRRRWRRRGR